MTERARFRPRGRPGFTLTEAAVAIVLGSIVLFSLVTLVRTTNVQRHLTEQQSGLISNGVTVDATLAPHLERAGRGLPSAPNFAGVHVDTATVGGAPADTLVTMWGVGPTWKASTYQCQSGSSDCVALIGSGPASELAAGDLVAVGHPKLGVRIVQVTGLSGPYTASAGADAGNEGLTCSLSDVGDIHDIVVTGSTYTPPSSGSTVSAEPCIQPYFPDGTTCTENASSTVVGAATATSCAATPSSTFSYVDVAFVDRTAAFGYPDQATWSSVSGANGAPMVRARQVEFARYWLDHAPDGPATLVSQTSMAGDGSFGAALPVAGGLTAFAVSVQHAGQAGFARGTGVAPSDLAFDVAANPNFTRATPTPTQAVEGWSFATSYRTIAAVRAAYRVETRDTGEGRDRGVPETLDLATHVATTGMLDGGAGFVP